MKKGMKKNAKAKSLIENSEELCFIEMDDEVEDLSYTEVVIECISDGGFDEDDEGIIERVRLL